MLTMFSLRIRHKNIGTILTVPRDTTCKNPLIVVAPAYSRVLGWKLFKSSFVFVFFGLLNFQFSQFSHFANASWDLAQDFSQMARRNRELPPPNEPKRQKNLSFLVRQRRFGAATTELLNAAREYIADAPFDPILYRWPIEPWMMGETWNRANLRNQLVEKRELIRESRRLDPRQTE